MMNDEIFKLLKILSGLVLLVLYSRPRKPDLSFSWKIFVNLPGKSTFSYESTIIQYNRILLVFFCNVDFFIVS